MNRSFKSIFNAVRGALVCVSECASSNQTRGKGVSGCKDVSFGRSASSLFKSFSLKPLSFACASAVAFAIGTPQIARATTYIVGNPISDDCVVYIPHASFSYGGSTYPVSGYAYGFKTAEGTPNTLTITTTDPGNVTKTSLESLPNDYIAVTAVFATSPDGSITFARNSTLNAVSNDFGVDALVLYGGNAARVFSNSMAGNPSVTPIATPLGMATGNTVNVTGGTWGGAIGGHGGLGSLNNTVNIDGGTVTGDIFGGVSLQVGKIRDLPIEVTIQPSVNQWVDADGDPVTIDLHTKKIVTVDSEPVEKEGGNRVVITKGTVGSSGSSIFGGYATPIEDLENWFDGSGWYHAIADENSVLLGGKNYATGDLTIKASNVYGGYARSRSGSRTATNNTIAIRATYLDMRNTSLYGGKVEGNGTVSGNKLEIWSGANGDSTNHAGITVNSIDCPTSTTRSFDQFTFVLPKDTQGYEWGSDELSGSDAMLTVKGDTVVNLTGLSAGGEIQVGMLEGSTSEFEGYIKLIEVKGGGTLGSDYVMQDSSEPSGDDASASFTLSQSVLEGLVGFEDGDVVDSEAGFRIVSYGNCLYAFKGEVVREIYLMDLTDGATNPSSVLTDTGDGNFYIGNGAGGTGKIRFDNDVENTNTKYVGIDPDNAKGVIAVYGGDSNDATGGSLNVGENSHLKKDAPKPVLYGGYAKTGTAKENTVTVGGGTWGNVTGGYSRSNEASGNKVEMIQGEIKNGDKMVPTKGTIVGDLVGGYSELGTASNNYLNLEAGTVKMDATSKKGGNVYGGKGGNGSKVTGNTIDLKGVNVTGGDLIGGYSTTGTVTNNTVNLEKGKVEKDKDTNNGGNIYAGRGGDGSVVNENTANLNGFSVTGNLVGGYSTNGTVTGNTVNLDSGIVNGKVIAGLTDDPDAKVNDNYIVITGIPSLEKAELYGARTSDDKAVSNTRGNTLAVVGTTGVDVKQIGGFDQYFFAMNNPKNGDKVLNIIGGEKTDLGTFKVGAITMKGSKPLQEGEEVTLIENPKGIHVDGYRSMTQGEVDTVTGQLRVRSKLDVTTNQLLEITDTPTAIIAKSTGTEASSESKSLLEGRMATVALLTRGADLIATQGIVAAVSAVEEIYEREYYERVYHEQEYDKDGNYIGVGARTDMGTYAVASAGKSKYITGSYVKSQEYSLMAGFSKQFRNSNNRVVLGEFVEAGIGDFDAHNEIPNGEVRADGDSHYAGVGVILRADFLSNTDNHPYLEASLRVGWNKTKYSSQDLGVKYKSDSIYFGGHAGLGYSFLINDLFVLYMDAKYMYMHQNKDKVELSDGSKLELIATDSQRVRAGMRLEGKFDNQGEALFYPYIGGYYEYEFAGEGKGKGTYGDDIAAPRLKGSNGLLDLGVKFKPSVNSPVKIELGAQGYVGKRRGAAATLRFDYRF